jgi:hypothetical protein
MIALCFYLIEWAFGDVPESSKETLYMETFSQNFPGIGLISEALGSITSWGSFLT